MLAENQKSFQKLIEFRSSPTERKMSAEKDRNGSSVSTPQDTDNVTSKNQIQQFEIQQISINKSQKRILQENP